MFITKKSKTSHVLQILLFFAAFHQGAQNCIKIKLLSVRSTDTINYKQQITETSDASVNIVTNVLKPIPTPLWNIQLLQSGEGFKKVHYIGNIKSCELRNHIKKIRLLRELTAPLLDPKNGNLSLTCPTLVGTYVIDNIFIPPESSFLRFLYMPKTILTVKGAVRSLLPNNIKEKLATFEFNLTMFRTC